MYSETFKQEHSWTSALYIHYTQINTEDKEARGMSSHSPLTTDYMDSLLCVTGERTNSCSITRSKWPKEIILPRELTEKLPLAGAGAAAQLVEYVSSMHTWGHRFHPQHCRDWNRCGDSGLWFQHTGARDRRISIQGLPQLHSKFKSTLGYLHSGLKKKNSIAGARKVSQQLRAHVTLTEGLDFLPSTTQ